jgi:hypothetical protein
MLETVGKLMQYRQLKERIGNAGLTCTTSVMLYEKYAYAKSEGHRPTIFKYHLVNEERLKFSSLHIYPWIAIFRI